LESIGTNFGTLAAFYCVNIFNFLLIHSFKCNVCGQHLTVLDAESHDNKPICKKCTNEILGVIYNSLSEIPEAPVIDTSKPIPLSRKFNKKFIKSFLKLFLSLGVRIKIY
jgi:hypothetical protein